MPRQSALGQHVLSQSGSLRRSALDGRGQSRVRFVRGKVRWQAGSIWSGRDLPLRRGCVYARLPCLRVDGHAVSADRQLSYGVLGEDSSLAIEMNLARRGYAEG